MIAEKTVHIVMINERGTDCPSFLEEQHEEDYYCLVWVRKANKNIVIDAEKVWIPSNSMLFLHENQLFYLFNNGFDGVLFALQPSIYKNDEMHNLFKLCAHLHALQYRKIVPIDNAILKCCLKNLLLENDKPSSSSKDRISLNLFYILLLEANKPFFHYTLHLAHSVSLNQVNDFFDLLELHFRKEKHVLFYVKEIGTTERILIESVRKILGCTPKSLIVRRIMIESRRLLYFSLESLTTISSQLGFNDVSYFIKFFTKNAGYPPRSFREQVT